MAHGLEQGGGLTSSETMERGGGGSAAPASYCSGLATCFREGERVKVRQGLGLYGGEREIKSRKGRREFELGSVEGSEAKFSDGG